MTRTFRGLLLAAGLLATAGAAQAAPSLDIPAAVRIADYFATLTFSSTQSQETATPFSATGGAGTIGFTGSLTTGTPCYDVTGSLGQRSRRVTVTVTAQGTGGICAQVITHNNYQGTVSDLAAGTYDFRIVHVVNGSSSTAYTQQVTVS
ncbi:MAG TPA: hypothetical protein VHG28_07440 [Longimicrobiaceae bacterium]|nr:hypothetical protein [Longimicrobiaceae bacterium]